MPANSSTSQIILTSVICVVILTLLPACVLEEPVIRSEPGLTTLPAPDTTSMPAAANSSYTGGILPHSLYYLSDDNAGVTQVWRLSPDGIAIDQITHAEADVSSFDISPVHGILAYIIAGRLLLQDLDGNNREVPIPVVGSTDDQIQGTDRLRSPRWSPDGNTLAYAQNGVFLYHLESGMSVMALPDGALMDNSPAAYKGVKARYSPYLWSPNNQQILVEIALPDQGSTLGILEIETGLMTLLTNSNPETSLDLICCMAFWTPESSAVYVANPYYASTTLPGLWRYDAHSGSGTALIKPISPDGTYNLVGWPFARDSGELVYFYANLPAAPVGDMPLTLVSSAPNATYPPVPLRLDTFLPREALWAPESDTSLVVIVQPVPGSQTQGRGGTAILVRDDGSPPQPLFPYGYSLAWGP